jgi:hypothetical protein
MLTFTDQQNMCKEISGLPDATSVLFFKRDLQAGTARFLANLSRPVDRLSRYASSVASQQYYQLAEDMIRVSKAEFLNGSQWIPLIEVGDEQTWIALNQTNQTGYPTHYFIRGYDEIGLFPIPSTAASNNIQLVFEPKHVLITADDYTTGTLSLTNGSQTVTGNSTVFTSLMANGTYVLQTTDGSDGNYYIISGYTNATTITLENYYQGATTAAATYRIGQVSKIPEEYQEAPVDYAMYRHYLGKGELKTAKLFQNNWEQSLKDAESTYGMSTGNQIVNASVNTHVFNPLTDITQNQIDV